MNLQDSQTELVFSYAQATAMLPLLRLIVADISLAHRDLTERKVQMHRIARRRENRKTNDAFYSDEIEVTRADLKEEESQLNTLIHELESLGVLLVSAHDGVVAFPALIEDRAAFYCWTMGDATISQFYWLGESLADRKPL